MLKFPVLGGILTLQSSRIISLESTMVSLPEARPSDIIQAVEKRIKVAIHLEYPEQTIAIGSTLTEEGRKAYVTYLDTALMYLLGNRHIPRTSVKGRILADFIVERLEDDSLDTPMEAKEELPDLWTRTDHPVLVEELKEKSINEAEVLAVVEEERGTWMTLIYNYLTEETLPAVKEKARDVRRNPGRSNEANHAKESGKLSPKWEGPYEVMEALGSDRNGKLLS
nr:reverse transcriptase domain-containing protein [Tanacetum cinerariifolium]